MMDRLVMEEIAGVESLDPSLKELRYGSKITQLVRHLLYIEDTEPQSKVYSRLKCNVTLFSRPFRIVDRLQRMVGQLAE